MSKQKKEERTFRELLDVSGAHVAVVSMDAARHVGVAPRRIVPHRFERDGDQHRAVFGGPQLAQRAPNAAQVVESPLADAAVNNERLAVDDGGERQHIEGIVHSLVHLLR